jgi:hypothetical protein
MSMKQTMTQQLVNLMDRAPVINQMYGPTAVNMPRLLAWILEFGFDVQNVEEFIKLPDDTRLLTALEEHELWYHGKVPPRKPDDNDVRHYLGHMQEFKTERFADLEKVMPGIAARARAHAHDHGLMIARLQEKQENDLMKAMQAQAMMGQGQNGGGSPVAGAGGPGQEPGSPNVRRNEQERGEGGREAQSEAMTNAPNSGAQ